MADSATIVVREVTGGSVLARSTSASGLEEARSDVACSSTGRDGFSAGRLMDQQQWLYRKKLTSSSSYTQVIEFSDDGSLLIAGGYGSSGLGV